MYKLRERAAYQHVINTADYERLTKNMSTGEQEGFKGSVTVIDKVNGVKVASLFNRNESMLDRAELQGGLNSQDYGKLSRDDMKALQVRNIKLDNTLPTVDVFGAALITRGEFERMIEAQREDAIKTKKIVDELPNPDLTRDSLHTVALNIANRTQHDNGGGVINPDNEATEE